MESLPTTPGSRLLGATSPIMRSRSNSVHRFTPTNSPFLQLDSIQLGKSKQEKFEGETRSDSLKRKTQATVFGLINASSVIPAMVGFASIIYKDPFYADHKYLPFAIKLVLLSSAIHQFCMVCLSSLSFAVGQTQDAGLIFLSAMSTTIVANLQNGSFDPDTIMCTTVVSLSLCTAMLGVLLVLTGKLKLARLVQYLPLPVIGGYLAYIGLFCGLAGVRLTTGQPEIENLLSIVHLFNWNSLRLLAPGLLSAALLYYVSNCLRGNQFALPLSMLGMLVAFYAAVYLSGHNLEDARNAGWLEHKVPMPSFLDVFKFYDISKVQWGAAFPQIIPTFFAMFVVVAFGSSLDVVAIQFELGRPLDYDGELVSIGYSNFAAGCLGGYSGSYIFSQTLFTLRNGITSRLCGAVIVIAELIVFAAPVDLLSIAPRFFFGSVLLYVSVELMYEWLLKSWTTIKLREYVLIWATFIFINAWGLEGGMALGFIASSLQFVYCYSRNTSGCVEKLPKLLRSHAVRSRADQIVLDQVREKIVALRLTGYHFFGTVIGTIVNVQSSVVCKHEHPNKDHDLTEPLLPKAGISDDRLRRAQETARSLAEELVRTSRNTERKPSDVRLSIDSRGQDRDINNAILNEKSRDIAMNGKVDSGNHEELAVDPEQQDTKFVILDFKSVNGVDTTAARACFMTILQSLSGSGIQLIFTGMSTQVRKLFESNGLVASPESIVTDDNSCDHADGEGDKESADLSFALTFDSVECALLYCEDMLLRTIAPFESGRFRSDSFFGSNELVLAKKKYFTQGVLATGTEILSRGKPADVLYVLESGSVKCTDDSVYSSRTCGGPLLGADAFFLEENLCRYTATVSSTAKFSQLSTEAWNDMKEKDPYMAIALQQAALEHMCLPACHEIQDSQ